MLRFSCPLCNYLLRIPENYIGTRGRCNRCNGSITVSPAFPAAIHAAGVAEPLYTITNLVARANGVSIRKQVTRTVTWVLAGSEAGDDVLALAERLNISVLSPEIFIRLAPVKESPGATAHQDKATQAQVDFLLALGLADEVVVRASKWQASAWLDFLQSARMETMPVTDKQKDFLFELGATSKDVAELKNAAEASRLIDRLIGERDNEELASIEARDSTIPPSPAQIRRLWKWGLAAEELLKVRNAAEATHRTDVLRLTASQLAEIPYAVKEAALRLQRR